MSQTKSNSVLGGMIWKTLEQYCVLGIQFVLQIVLARLIAPESYGVIAIASVFITISAVFINNSFSIALVRNKSIDDETISSIFIFSLLVALVLYGLIFVSAPAVSDFFKMPELSTLLRIMTIGLFPSAYNSIKTALLRRKMAFKPLFFSSIIAVFVSGIIAIVMAFKGYSVWALAAQYLVQVFVTIIVLFIWEKWLPSIKFSFSKIKDSLSFGWKILVTSFIDESFAELRVILIGKFYSSADLSFYNRGKQFPFIMTKAVNGSMQSVLLPVMSKKQDDKEQLRSVLHSSVTLSSFVMFPLLIGLACVAENLVIVLLTDKWLPCVAFLQLHCAFYIVWPIVTSGTQALWAIGKSGSVMYAEVTRKIVDLIVLIISLKYGVLWIAIGSVLVSFISIPLYLIPCKKYLGYSVAGLFRSTAAPLAGSAFMAVCILCVSFLSLPVFAELIVQIIVGIASYYMIARLTKMPHLNMFLSFLRPLIRKASN